MTPLAAFAITTLVWINPSTGDVTEISSYAPGLASVAASIGMASVGQRVDLAVPFIPQAPGGAWSDPILADACEEASVLMSAAWAQNRSVDPRTFVQDIHAMGAYEEARFGTHVDTSAADTAILLREYLGIPNVELRYDVGASDIHALLEEGSIVILPVDGTVLANPHYSDGGPPRHMIVARGFDDSTGVFLANDPGTAWGGLVSYDVATVGAAIRDYSTGVGLPVIDHRTAAIIVRR